MPAYLVAQLEVQDKDMYQRYRDQVGSLVDRFGGRFLVRGGKLEVREGDWPLKRLVVVEFQSLDAARHFYDSPEYQRILPLRTGASRGTLALVEGVD
jgi:uncharacterized protein (DUF1330 family)